MTTALSPLSRLTGPASAVAQGIEETVCTPMPGFGHGLAADVVVSLFVLARHFGLCG